jgi:hypothetical protein
MTDPGTWQLFAAGATVSVPVDWHGGVALKESSNHWLAQAHPCCAGLGSAMGCFADFKVVQIVLKI